PSKVYSAAASIRGFWPRADRLRCATGLSKNDRAGEASCAMMAACVASSLARERRYPARSRYSTAAVMVSRATAIVVTITSHSLPRSEAVEPKLDLSTGETEV